MQEPPSCPVCQHIFVRPRLFPCGHALCEQCSWKNDVHTEPGDIRTAISYRCVVCREKTLVPWHRRAIARDLDMYCQTAFRELYEQRQAAIEAADIPAEPDWSADWGQIARTSREQVLNELMNEIGPPIIQAAYNGSACITISQPNLVRKARQITSSLASRLFDRGIHRVLVTPEEIQIYITNESNSFRSDFVNPASSPTLSLPGPYNIFSSMRRRRRLRASNTAGTPNPFLDDVPQPRVQLRVSDTTSGLDIRTEMTRVESTNDDAAPAANDEDAPAEQSAASTASERRLALVHEMLHNTTTNELGP